MYSPHSPTVTKLEAAKRLLLRPQALLGVAIWTGFLLVLLTLSAHG